MPQKEFVLEIAHRVHYSNREPIPIAEIASSLLALERLLLRTPRVFSMVTSVPIERAEVFVEEIYTGSLVENVVVRIFFKDQAELDAFLLKIHEKLGQHKVFKNVLLGTLILSVIGAGLYGAAKAMGSGEASNAISVNNNVIINIGAEQSGMAPAQLEKIILSAITDKKANARDAVEFVRPAKRDTEAMISLEDSALLTIPKNVIAQVPSKLVIEAKLSEEFFPDVDLHVRATNLDSQSAGWAGIIPSLINRRVKLVLAERIDPKKVAGKFKVRADVIVHSRPQGPKNEPRPYQITLVNLIEE